MKKIIRLTESDLVKIVKMVINEDDPKTPTAAAKTPVKPIVVNFKMCRGSGPIGDAKKGIVQCNVTATPRKNDRGIMIAPDRITLNLLGNDGKFNPLVFRLIGNSVYNPENPSMKGQRLVDVLRTQTERVAEGIMPATALTQMTNQISQSTGQQVSIESSVLNTIASVYNSINKTGVINFKQTNITSGVLLPYKRISLNKFINPETNKEYTHERKLVLGNGAAGFRVMYDKVAEVTNVSSSEEIAKYLRANSRFSESMTNSYIINQAKSEAQDYYNQLNQ